MNLGCFLCFWNQNIYDGLHCVKKEAVLITKTTISFLEKKVHFSLSLFFEALFVKHQKAHKTFQNLCGIQQNFYFLMSLSWCI